MAFVGRSNINIGTTGFSGVLFYTLQAMIENGWELMSFGQGQSGDAISGPGRSGLQNTGSGGGGGITNTDVSV